jgi:signal transduction histidine kinase
MAIEEAFPGLAGTEVPARYRRAAADGEVWSTDQIVYEDARVVGAYEVRAFQTVPGRMAAVFSDVTERRRALEALRLRERFMASLAGVSRELLQARNPVDVLPGILKRLGEVAEVSRVCLVENDVAADGSITLSGRFDWSAEGVAHCMLDSGEASESYEAAGLARWVEVLGAGEVIAGPVEGLPPTERSFLARQGIQSIVVAPVVAAGDWYGFVALEDCSRPRHWEQEVDLLRIAAAEIGAAIVNARLLADVQRHALELEERVAERTAELAAVNTELEAFAYSVSHDLRAPLHAIDGFSQALLEDYSAVLDADGRDYLERVRTASQRMGRLIDGLLRLSRVSRREMRRETIDVSALVRSTVAELEQRSGRRDVDVVVADGLVTAGDADLLRIAFENLLGNAWKFSALEPTPRIEVGAERQSGELVLFVRDNGAGFDMAYADQLFGAFQRLHSERDFEGTGIGLATVKRIVNRHGGRVWASAAVGEGASFFVFLPGSKVARRDRV